MSELFNALDIMVVAHDGDGPRRNRGEEERENECDDRSNQRGCDPAADEPEKQEHADDRSDLDQKGVPWRHIAVGANVFSAVAAAESPQPCQRGRPAIQCRQHLVCAF